MLIVIDVTGRPAPQGSHELGGAGQLLDSSPYLRSWRAAVKIACFRAYQLTGVSPTALPLFGTGVPVTIESLTFFVGEDQCRAEGTDEPIGKPDIDKLLRATLDALGGARAGTGKLFADDSQVVRIDNLTKVRTHGFRSAGAHIIVSDGRD
jgi:hypothetical protein